MFSLSYDCELLAGDRGIEEGKRAKHPNVQKIDVSWLFGVIACSPVERQKTSIRCGWFDYIFR
jgi:hypothetical protein